MAAPSIEPLIRLAADTRRVTRSARAAFAGAVGALVVLAALFGARRGTTGARIGALVAMGVAALALAAWELRQHRRYSGARRFLEGPVRRVDPGRAGKVLRALSLLAEPAGPSSTSTELARLHVERAIAQLPAQELAERATRVASVFSRIALALFAITLGRALVSASTVAEGADVLAARNGVAPVAMSWLEGVDVSARPPEYLHQPELHQLAFQSIILPAGTSITMRGTPVRSGRRLLLSDGTQEIPFVDDGNGAVVARWPLTQSRSLRVVARFGDVVIPAPDSLEVQSIDDERPVVHLEDAPREVKLIEADADIPIRFDAEDDHGLREVQLVLRSGAREERRQLAHLDGETRSFRSGSVLKLRDPFLKKSHVPVSVTVEAKDNDPLTGPKWGASEAITVVPPDVGEPEARRLEAMRALRDALVDTLAVRLDREQNEGWAAVAAEDGQRQTEDDRRTAGALSESYGGLRVPARVRAVIAAGQQATRKAVDAEGRRPSAAAHTAVVHATEQLVLVVDAVVRGLGQRDTRTSAVALADVADDLANNLNAAVSAAADGVAKIAARQDADTRVLVAGGGALRRLGGNGRELGEIVDADLARVGRARTQKDAVHAELATRDLAARLRQPDPSFGSRGGSGRGGDEAGNAKGAAGQDEGEPDDVERAFDEAAQELERLAQDHAGEIAKMEQALAGAVDDEEMKELRDEAKHHADAIRDAVQQLPRVGLGSDSWTAKGAAARELAEQMARSLEEGRPGDAAQSGRSAVGSIDEAKRVLQHGGWFEDPDGQRQGRLDETRRKLDAEMHWAEDRAAEGRRRASARAREQLQKGGQEEARLADRAGEIGRKALEHGALPEQATESLEEAQRAAEQAAQSLREGSGDKGLEHQREAQRHLEAVQEQLRGDDEESPSGGPGDGRLPSRDPVAIPDAKDHKGPEAFRRRVMRGLGERSNGALRDAVQRYAEGLLR